VCTNSCDHCIRIKCQTRQDELRRNVVFVAPTSDLQVLNLLVEEKAAQQKNIDIKITQNSSII
jgi:hypothetical protein